MTLKELRKSSGLTQEQVARLVDVDQAAVSHWENGRHAPGKKYQKKLAKLYGCTLAELKEAMASDDGGSAEARV